MPDTTGQEPTADEAQVAQLAAAALAADTAAKATADAATKAAADATEATEKKYSQAYVTQLRNEAAAARVRLKELTDAEDARKLAEMSEADRLKKQLADAESKARILEIQSIRMNAATKHKLPDDLHEFITAEDEAGALAQAEKLAARIKSEALPAGGGRNPPNGGEQGRAQDEQTRFSDLKSRVPALNNRMLRS